MMPLPERVIGWLARLVPRWRRDDWRQEWAGELDHFRDRHTRFDRFDRSARRQLTLRACGAAFHVADLWRHEWSLDMLWNDTVFAVRRFVHRPVLAIAVVATLAVTIGVTTAIFTLVDGILLRPLPYPDADRIVAIWPRTSVSPEYALTLQRDAAGDVASVAAYSGWGFSVSTGESTERLDGARVTIPFFDVLGTRPVAGRTFVAGDDAPGVARVVVSEAYRRRYPERARVGASLLVNGRPHEVIGVVPASFRFPGRSPEIWTLLPASPPDPNFRANLALVIGRMKAGDTPTLLEARLRPLWEARADAPRVTDAAAAAAVAVRPLRDVLVGDVSPVLRVLFGAVLLVLLAGALNVANLLLADVAARLQELSVRMALGAGRRRLLRQLGVEALLLGGTGAAAGLAGALYLVEALRRLLPPDTPRLHEIGIDARVLTFAVAVTLGIVVSFAVLSAIAANRSISNRGLRGAARGASGGDRLARRIRTTLVAAEVALAMVLVTAAALVARSYQNVVSKDPGFDATGVLAVSVSLPANRYQGRDRTRAGLEAVEARLRSLPGVSHVGAIQLLPMTPGNWDPSVQVDGAPPLPAESSTINWRAVTTEYFAAMGIARVRGRSFSGEDAATSQPVAIVNERFVATILAGADPIGRRIRTGFEPRETWTTIVGVVADTRQHALAEPPRPEMYRPLSQHPIYTTTWVIRSATDPAALAPVVRQAVRELDPEMALGALRPLSALVHQSGATFRAAAVLLLSLAGGTFALALIGIVGLSAYEIAQRRGEIGIRLALGATRGEVLRLLLRRSVAIGAAGIAAGGVLAFMAGDGLEAVLLDVPPHDPWTYAAVAATLIVSGVAASYLPARRAASLPPVEVLRLQ